MQEIKLLARGLEYTNRDTREIQMDQLTLGTETAIKYAQEKSQVYRRIAMMRNIKAKHKEIHKTIQHHISIQRNKAYRV